jgi:hypothetical protein
MEAGKYLRTEVQEEPEEIFDEELQCLFGEKYQDVSAEPPAEAGHEPVQKEEGSTETRVRWGRLRAGATLIVGVGLLFYMILGGKIDTAYGVLFTAGLSAACGYSMK